MIDLVIFSEDSRKHFSCDPINAKARIDYIDQSFLKGTVISLQETHDGCDTASSLLGQVCPSFELDRSHLSQSGGGILIAVRRAYSDLFETEQQLDNIYCRVIPVVLIGRRLKVIFTCAHIYAMSDFAEERCNMIRAIHSFLQGKKAYSIFIMGDFAALISRTGRQ